MATNRMRNHLRTVGIELFMTSDGETARGLVSHLAWIVGIGAEIAANTAPGSDLARRQHAMLRNLVQIATEGCAWRAALAEQIWTAAQEGHDLMVRHPTLGLAVLAGADHLAARVAAGDVCISDVAGAEIYREAAH
ncbi:hypothetical protein [Roseateles sp.]|uniref:hypothetical protein n=1 Tax=Roseateles sp. TaxID=1971397 RepID=UPI003BAC6D60